ncbi:Gti1/Pac2 family-domain-containing protein [Obelidium mucronatum]|nr:Gti1/Pac2 family-domain-containing protein [Obelidium mucronatum]
MTNNANMRPAPQRLTTQPNYDFETFYGWIQNRADAFLVIEACVTGMLHPVMPYMHTSTEIRSGSVVVFTQRSTDVNSIRWRDGRNWTTSKLSENFLLYRETEPKGSPYRGPETCALFPAGSLRPNTQLVPDGITLTGSDGLRYRVISYFKPKDVEHRVSRKRATLGLGLKTPSELHEFDEIKRVLASRDQILSNSPNNQLDSSTSPNSRLPGISALIKENSMPETLYRMRYQGRLETFGCSCGGLGGLHPFDYFRRDPSWLNEPVILAPLWVTHYFLKN